MSTPDEVRARVRESWEDSAEHWGRVADRLQRRAMPVSEWILDAACLRSGHRVLELACGAGDTGLMAAGLVAPGGEVLLTDSAEGMVEQARARVHRAGVENAAFEVLDAEWIDKPAAAFDAVLCRWGLMFPVDLEAAFRECRRVLKPGGRLALAAWDAPEKNPWASETTAELLEQGLIEPPPPDSPGPFRLADHERLRGLLLGAGFAEVLVEPLPTVDRYDSFEDFWALQSELSVGIRRALALTNERGREALRAGIAGRLERYGVPDGGLRIPATALMAAATA